MYKINTTRFGEVAIDFRHQQHATDSLRKASTVCVIAKLNENGVPDTRSIIVSGYAACSHVDNFSRKEGRKLAFMRALDSMLPENYRKETSKAEGMTDYVPKLERQDRKEILEGYFAQRRYAGDF